MFQRINGKIGRIEAAAYALAVSIVMYFFSAVFDVDVVVPPLETPFVVTATAEPTATKDVQGKPIESPVPANTPPFTPTTDTDSG